jgi:two-component system, probable response regulator PhcQ
MNFPLSTPETHSGQPMVLIVDDDSLLRAGLRCMLRKFPYQVMEASEGSVALKIMSQTPCDLLVTDDRMPGMRGTDLVAKVALAFPRVPRIVLTGQATLETAMQAINFGHVFRFLRKPCPPEEFQAAVAEGLAEHQRLLAAYPAAESESPIGDGLESNSLLGLSAREEEIRKWVAAGWRLNQIAEKLFLSRHTVRNHLKSVFRKLNIHSQTDLTTKTRRLPPAS